MGSVIDYDICKNCGYKYAQSEYYYKSDDLYEFCPHCGKFHKRYRNHEQDANNPTLTDEEGGGYGTLTIHKANTNVAAILTLEEGEDGFAKVTAIKNDNPDVVKIEWAHEKDGEWLTEVFFENGSRAIHYEENEEDDVLF